MSEPARQLPAVAPRWRVGALGELLHVRAGRRG
uniref:Uncharacterized protein n=1 Tax=Arundo donax TaxID=35708 RepID=A0A0A8ZRL1_ARUDO